MCTVVDIAAQLHSLPDAGATDEPLDEESSQAIAQLARALSEARSEEDESALVSDIRRTGVVGPIVRILSHRRDDTQLMYVGLSILVNLADAGGADVVLLHRGGDLLIELLSAEDVNIAYYAVAGVQNLSCSPDCVHLVLDARADELLRTMLKESENQHIKRCAAGALANIRASAPYKARLAAERTAEERMAAQGPPASPSASSTSSRSSFKPRKWSPRSEESLQRALEARIKSDALVFETRWRAAVLLQAAARRRLGVRALQALQWRERAIDIAEVLDGAHDDLEPLPDERVAELTAIATRLRSACDTSAETKAAVLKLATELSEADDALCLPLLRTVAQLDPIRPLVRLLSTVDPAAHAHLMHIGLSALVNLADIGGAALLNRAGGVDLLLRMLPSSDESVAFLAAAGVHNVLSTRKMLDDAECMTAMLRHSAEAALDSLVEHPNESVSRSAAGALANLSQSAVLQQLKDALAVAEHYRSQAQLDMREQSKGGMPGIAGSCDGSPRSVAAELANMTVYDAV